jgi:hypothetical protein
MRSPRIAEGLQQACPACHGGDGLSGRKEQQDHGHDHITCGISSNKNVRGESLAPDREFFGSHEQGQGWT